MRSEDSSSRTSNPSWQQPSRFERVSTSSFACANMGAQDPPLASTILPLRSSTQGLRSFSALDIVTVFPANTIRVGAARIRFSPEDVGTHSLQSGGSMAICIMGVPEWILVIIGWWRLLGFMVYIQQNISSFIAGVSVKMSQ